MTPAKYRVSGSGKRWHVESWDKTGKTLFWRIVAGPFLTRRRAEKERKKTEAAI